MHRTQEIVRVNRKVEIQMVKCYNADKREALLFGQFNKKNEERV